MKSKLIPLAAAVASVIAVSAHATGPIDGKVYGKLRISADYIKTQKSHAQNQSEGALESHASRIGFKGATPLSDMNDLSVIYQAEYGIDGNITGNSGKNWTTRNTFVGLKGGFGTIFGGTHDTPFKGAQGHVDEFNDLDGDMSAIFNGEDRLSQLVMYKTPSMGPLKASLAYVMSNGQTGTINNQKSRDGISAAVMFDQGMFYGSVAYNNDINNMNSVRVTGVVKPVSNLQLGAMFQQSKCNDAQSSAGNCQAKAMYGVKPGDSENGYLVSAGYTIGRTTLKAEYGSSDIYKISKKAAYKDDLSVGASYKLASKTNLEGWVSQLKNSDNSDKKVTYVALGLQHKF